MGNKSRILICHKRSCFNEAIFNDDDDDGDDALLYKSAKYYYFYISGKISLPFYTVLKLTK